MANTRIMSANSTRIIFFTNIPKLDAQELFPSDFSIQCRGYTSIATEDLVDLVVSNAALGDSSSCAASTLLDGIYDFRPKLGNSTSHLSSATATTSASTMVESLSSSELSPASSGESLPSAVAFANRCLVRSYERRSRSNITLPSYAYISSSISSSSNATQKSFSVVSHESISSSSTASFQSHKSGRQSSRRDQEIKIKLMKMRIMIYRLKCARSLNKAMIHYNRLNTSTALLVSNFTTNCQAEPTTDAVSDIPNRKTSVNLLFGRINSLFILYEDSLSHIIHLL